MTTTCTKPEFLTHITACDAIMQKVDQLVYNTDFIIETQDFLLTFFFKYR